MDKSVERYRARRDARMKKRLDDFSENDHPRDENGRFTSGGGGGSQAGGAKAAKQKERVKQVEEVAKVMAKNKPYMGANDAWKNGADRLMDIYSDADSDEQKELNKILEKYGLH